MTRVLLVDHSPTFARALQMALERRGLVVQTVCEGYLALLQLQIGLADVCLLDAHLPSLDSLSLLRKARAGGVDTPIMVLSSQDLPAGRVTWYESGADDLICKPFDPDELVARIRVLHQRRSGRLPGAMELGPLRFDMLSDSFALNGDLLILTPKEHVFLKSLMARPGFIAPKDRVFRSVFGDATVGSGALDVLACRVRRKLTGSGVHMSTIRGMGYLLRSDRCAASSEPVTL